MAANTIIANVKVQADTKEFKANIQSAMSELNKIANNQPLKFDSSELKAGVQSAKDLRTALQSALSVDMSKINMSTFSSSLKKAGTDLATIRDSMSAFGVSGERAFDNVASSIMNASQQSITLNQHFSNLLTNLKKTAQWQISSSIIHGFVGKIQEAVGYAKNLNESLNNIQIVTQMSSSQIADFAAQAQKAAKSLSSSTLAFSDAALIYFQQGDQMVTAMQKAEITMKAAAISFNSSAKDMSEYLTAIWNSYQVGEEEMQRYVDIMANLGANTATSMEEISTALRKVAATANNVGVDMEQMSTIIATSASVTRQSAEIIGTAWNTILSRIGGLKLGETLEDGVDLNKYSKALKSVGIDVLDASGNLREMGVVIDEIGAKWQSMSKAQQSALAQTIGGTRQYTQMMAFFDNYKTYEINLEIAEESTGALDKQFATWEKSWEAATGRMKNAWQGLYNEIINDEVFITLTDAISSTINAVTSLIDALGGITPVLATIGSTFMTYFANSGGISKLLTNLGQNLNVITGRENKNQIAMNQEFASLYKADANKYKGVDASREAGANANATIFSSNARRLQTERKWSEEQKIAYSNQEQALKEINSARARVTMARERASARYDAYDQTYQTGTDLQNIVKTNYGKKGTAVKTVNDSLKTVDTVVPALKAETQAVRDATDGIDAAYKAFTHASKAGQQAAAEALEKAAKEAGEAAKNAIKAAAEEKGQIEAASAKLETVSTTNYMKTDDSGNTSFDADQAQADFMEATGGRTTVDPKTITSQTELTAAVAAANTELENQSLEMDNVIQSGQDLIDSVGGAGEEVANMGQKLGDLKEEEELLTEQTKEGAKELEKLSEVEPPKISDAVAGLASSMIGLVSSITMVVSAFNTLTNPDTTGIEKVMAAVSLLAGAIMFVQSAISAVNAVKTLGIALSSWAAAANGVEATSLVGLAGVMTIVKTAAIKMWAAITGPVGLAIAAVAAITVAIIALVSAFKSAETPEQKVAKKMEEISNKMEKTHTSSQKLQTDLQNLSSIMADTTLTYEDQIAKINEITEAYGIQANVLEVLSGNYGTLINKMTGVAKARIKINRDEAESELDAATRAAEEYRGSKVSWNNNNGLRDQEINRYGYFVGEGYYNGDPSEGHVHVVPSGHNNARDFLLSLESGNAYGGSMYDEQWLSDKDNFAEALYDQFWDEAEAFFGQSDFTAKDVYDNWYAIAMQSPKFQDWYISTHSGQPGIGQLRYVSGEEEISSKIPNYLVPAQENRLELLGKGNQLTRLNNDTEFQAALEETGWHFNPQTYELESKDHSMSIDSQVALYRLLTGEYSGYNLEGSYFGTIVSNLKSGGIDTLSAAQTQYRDEDLLARLFSSNSNFKPFGVASGGQPASAKDVWSILTNVGAKTDAERQTLLGYMSGYEGYGDATQQVLAINQLASQAAVIPQISSKDGRKLDKEALTTQIMSDLLGGDNAIEADILLRLNATDIEFNEETGSYQLREGAREYAQAQIDREVAQTNQEELAANEKIATGKTISKDQYQTLSQMGIFKDNKDALNRFVQMSASQRAEEWQRMMDEQVDNEITALRQEQAYAITRLEELGDESSGLIQDALSRLNKNDDRVLKLFRENGINETTSGKAAYDALFEIRAEKQAQLDDITTELNAAYGVSQMTGTRDEKNAAAKALGYSSIEALEEKIPELESKQQALTGTVAEYNAVLGETDSLLGEVTTTTSRLHRTNEELDAAEYWQNYGRELKTAQNGVTAFSSAMNKMGSVSGETLSQMNTLLKDTNDNIYELYDTMSADEWNTYVYGKAAKYYDDLIAYYESVGDHGAAIEARQNKINLQTQYYDTKIKSAQKSIKAVTEQWDKTSKAQESASSTLTNYITKLDSLTFENIKTLTKNLEDAGIKAERVTELINKIQNASTDKQKILAGVETYNELALAQLQSYTTQQQAYDVNLRSGLSQTSESYLTYYADAVARNRSVASQQAQNEFVRKSRAYQQAQNELGENTTEDQVFARALEIIESRGREAQRMEAAMTKAADLAEQNTNVYGEYVADQIRTGAWLDQFTAEQKVAVDTASQRVFETMEGVDSLADITAENYDEFITNLETELKREGQDINVKIDGVWDTIHSTWKSGLSNLYAEEQEIAQKTYQLWSDTFDAIAKARQGLLKGKSILETMAGDQAGLKNIILSMIKEGASDAEIQTRLNATDINQANVSFTPWDAESYRNSGAQKFLNFDNQQFNRTTVEQYNQRVADYVNGPLSQELSQMIGSNQQLSEQYVQKLARSENQTDKLLLQELVDSGAVIYNAKTQTYTSNGGRAIDEGLLAQIKQEFISELQLHTQQEVDEIFAEADATQKTERYTRSATLQSEGETWLSERSSDKAILDTAREALLNGDDLSTKLNEEEQARLLKLTGASDLTAVSLTNVNTAAQTLTTSMVTMASELGRAMAMVQSGEADSWSFGDDGHVHVRKNQTYAEIIASGGSLTEEEQVEATRVFNEQGYDALNQMTFSRDVSLGTNSVNAGDTVNGYANAVTENDTAVLESYANQVGMTSDNFEALAKSIAESGGDMRDLSEMTIEEKTNLYNLAKQVAETANAWDDLTSSQSDNISMIKKGEKANINYKTGLQAVMKDVKTIFNNSEHVTESFVEENIDLIEDMANGVEGAAEKVEEAVLRAQAEAEGWDYDTEIKVKVDVDNDGVADALGTMGELINNFGDQYADIPVGVSIDDTAALAAMTEMLNSGQMTAEQMEEAFNSVGWDPEIEWNEYTLTEEDVGRGYVEAPVIDPITGEVTGYQQVPIQSDYEAGQTIRIPSINGGSGGTFKKTGTGASSGIKPTSSSSSGGGGGGSKTTKDKKDATDEIERYHVISEQLGIIQRALTKIDKLKSAAWGSGKLKAINDEIAALEREADVYAAYAEEAADWLAQDQAALSAEGATFNDDGSLANYTSLMQQWVDEYNAAVEAFNASEQTDADSDAFEKAEELYEDRKKMIENYEESYQTYQEQINNYLDTLNKLSAARLEKITYKVELQVELNESDRKVIDYFNKKLSDSLSTQSESMSKYIEKQKSYESDAKEYADAIAKLEEEHQKWIDSGGTEGINDSDYATTLKDYRDKLTQTLSDMYENEEKIKQVYSDAISKANEELSEHTNIISHTIDMMNSYIEIMGLLGKKVTYDDLKDFYDTQYNAALSMIKVSKERADVWQKEMDYYAAKEAAGIELSEIEQEQYKKAKEEYISAQNDLVANTKTALENLQEAHQAYTDQVLDDLSRINTGSKATIQDVSDAYNNWNEETSRYLATGKQLYEVNKLNRKIEDSIADASTKASKERLAALQDVINAQAKNNKLTEYSIKQFEYQYELALAMQELEEAQNAKSTVRLVRDENGGYGYQYTADQDTLDAAEQHYEDVLENIRQLTTDTADQMAQGYINARIAMEQKLAELDESDFKSHEEYLAKRDEIIKYYSGQMGYYSEQYSIVTGDLQENLLALSSHYGEENISVSEEMKSTLNDDVEEMMDNHDEYVSAVQDAVGLIDEEYDNYHTKIDEITNASGLDFTSMMNSLDGFRTQTEQAQTAAENITTTLGTELDQIHEVTEEWDDHKAKIEDTIDSYEELIDNLGDVLDDLADLQAALDEINDSDTTHVTATTTTTTTPSPSADTTSSSPTSGTQTSSTPTSDTHTHDKKEQMYVGSERHYKCSICGKDMGPVEGTIGSQQTHTNGGGCFAAGTKITMADLQKKNIEEVKMGDKVMAYNQKTNEFEEREVIGFYIHHNTARLQSIHLSDGNELLITPSHPILTTNGWKSSDFWLSLIEHHVIAAQLQIGDIVIGQETNAAVIEIEELPISINYDTYNISVDTIHTFIANGVVVHNTAVAYVTKYATGGLADYTGPAWVDGSPTRPELVLNPQDTFNLLSAVEMLRDIVPSIMGMFNTSALMMGHQLDYVTAAGQYYAGARSAGDQTLEQEVHITAEFPNVTDRYEIEEAFNSLIDQTAQYINRKVY